ncbi:MAG: hypothetical protein NTU44_02835 [Bacteroidetes bacterium]|nr:hypothetical protein [Bacteroidota bacterium]
MKFIKYIRQASVATAGLLLLTCPQAMGQTHIEGLAGPDKHTCKNPNSVFETIPVRIGPASTNSSWCYYWTPATGLDNPNTANPNASPPDNQIYTLHVVGDNFAYEVYDEMTVFVDQVNSLNVTANQCCWSVGDKFLPEQFNIVTDPPGMEKQVIFDPPTAPYVNNHDAWVTIIAKLNCMNWDNPLSVNVNVHVVNGEYATQQLVGIPDIGAFGGTALIKKIDALIEKLSKFSEVPGFLCQPGFSQALEASYNLGKMCCPSADCVTDQLRVALTYKPNFAVTCDAPFAGIPYVASLNVRFGFSTSLYVTGDYKSTCDNGQFCFGATADINIFGGLSGTLIGGLLGDVSATFVPYVSTPTIQFCVPSNSTIIQGKFGAGLDAYVDVIILSGGKYHYQVPIITKRYFY